MQYACIVSMQATLSKTMCLHMCVHLHTMQAYQGKQLDVAEGVLMAEGIPVYPTTLPHAYTAVTPPLRPPQQQPGNPTPAQAPRPEPAAVNTYHQKRSADYYYRYGSDRDRLFWTYFWMYTYADLYCFYTAPWALAAWGGGYVPYDTAVLGGDWAAADGVAATGLIAGTIGDVKLTADAAGGDVYTAAVQPVDLGTLGCECQ
jgi:hypothetical protein